MLSELKEDEYLIGSKYYVNYKTDTYLEVKVLDEDFEEMMSRPEDLVGEVGLQSMINARNTDDILVGIDLVTDVEEQERIDKLVDDLKELNSVDGEEKINSMSEEKKTNLWAVHDENDRDIVIHDVEYVLDDGGERLVDIDSAIEQYEKGNWDYVDDKDVIEMTTTREIINKMEKKLEETKEVEEASAISHQNAGTEQDIIDFYVEYEEAEHEEAEQDGDDSDEC